MRQMLAATLLTSVLTVLAATMLLGHSARPDVLVYPQAKMVGPVRPDMTMPDAAGAGMPGMGVAPGGTGEAGAAAAAQLAWDALPGWSQVEGMAGALATFQVVLPDGGQPAELTLWLVSGGEGMLAGNVARWRRQLGLPPQDPDAILAAAASDSSGLGPVRWWRLAGAEQGFLAALIPVGDRLLSAKLSTDPARLDVFQPVFLRFVRSLRPAEQP